MADPFVQRMMARKQARLAALTQTLGDSTNKENVALSSNARSRLDQISSLYTDDNNKLCTTPLPTRSLSPPQSCSKSTYSTNEKVSNSPNKTPFVTSLTDSGLGEDQSPTSCTVSKSEGSQSPRKSRFTVLAQRCHDINNWEDDCGFRSNSHGSQVEVAGSSVSPPMSSDVHDLSHNLHEPKCQVKTESQVSQSAIKTNPSLSPRHPSASLTEIAVPPKYYFGEGPQSRSSSKGDCVSVACSSVSSNTSSSFSSYCTGPQQSSPSRYTHSRINITLRQTESPSPSRKLEWDKGMLTSLISMNGDIQDTLEAQGFTPSDSGSRLCFDFKKGKSQETKMMSPDKQPPPSQKTKESPVSPSKVRGMSLAEFVQSTSPERRKSPQKNVKTTVGSTNVSQISNTTPPLPPPPPPVVVSCLPKSREPSPNPALSSAPSQECSSHKVRSRDTSPSKVGEMRSRWEQHIRDASPERLDRSRSPIKNGSRCGSPTKFSSPERISRSNLNARSVENPVKVGSPVKTNSPIKVQSPIRSVPEEPIGFSRFGVQRKSRRDLSPHKPPPVGDVVKGEAPMPEATPLIKEPTKSSVMQKVAAFNSAVGPVEPEKDPAERTLQERKAMFNKQSAALVPKAPFGQSVPVKALSSDGAVPQKVVSKSSVVHSKPVQKPTKKIASGPSPAITQKLQEIQKGKCLTSDEEEEPTSFESQRKMFENIKDNWRKTEINNKVQTERQKEMDVLLNRFKKPKSAAQSSAPAVQQSHHNASEMLLYPEESESGYAESDESYADSTTSENTSMRDEVMGPPKPPRMFLPSSSVGSPLSPSSSPSRNSEKGRLNSTEIEEVHASPKKEFVARVKPGFLYPALSDIESHSEAQDSQEEDDVAESSFAESVLTCASMESLGKKIQKAATPSITKQLSSIEERSENGCMTFMSESTMEAIESIDAAIDEALDDDDDEPTPPKRHRSCDDTPSSVYKTPRITLGSPSNEDDQENPLAHSISMYRKQRPEVTYTPVRQIIRRPDLRSPSPEPAVSPSVAVSARIGKLQENVEEQQRVISQASNAVTVVLQRTEHQGTPQHVEAEKLLLLANQKRQTALNEIQRLKAEGALAQNSWPGEEDMCRGSISINSISVPLKQDFLRRERNGDNVYHLLVLVKHRDQVISSELLTTPQCIVDGAITFPNLMSLHNLTSDFNITLEVYALCTQQPRQHNIKKEQSRMKLTPLKRLQKSESRMCSPSVQSPGGPYAVRTSAFQLVGFTHLNISTLTRNAWTLEKVPFSSPLDGHLLMRVNCTFEGGITERGFLTMFEDVGGFGAWNRRWCVLSGMHLRYWRYPDDENKKEANGQIDLRSCTTRRVELVSRDICARQHTFQLTCVRPARHGDIDNLVQEVQGSSLVSKLLMSADSKEERIVWCNKLTKALANIRAWDPDALRPEDYHV